MIGNIPTFDELADDLAEFDEKYLTPQIRQLAAKQIREIRKQARKDRELVEKVKSQ